MSEAAFDAKLELLEEESLQARETLQQLKTRSGHAELLEDDERLELLQSLRDDVLRLRAGFHRLQQDALWPPAQVLSKRAPNACFWADIVDADGELSGGNAENATRNSAAELDQVELSLWDGRVAAARETMQLMKHEVTSELRDLEREVTQAETFRSVGILAPEIPSQPGAPCADATLSLPVLLAELARELDALEAPSLDAVSIAVEPAHVRALQTLDVQLQLQVDCRRLEPKVFENEAVDDVEGAAGDKVPLIAVDRASRLASTLQGISFSRTKLSLPLRLLPRPPMTSASMWPESERVRAAFLKKVASVNACEGFCGYVKELTVRLATLQNVAGITFELVPEHTYRLGCADPTQRCSLHPVAGSVDHESRLDRRTLFWLMSGAAQKKGGLAFEDGPMHFMYSGRARDVSLPGFHVMKDPLTRVQFHKLMEDRRFADALAKRVPVLYRNANRRLEFSPLMLNHRITDFKVTEHWDTTDGNPLDDDSLEVPYFVAKAIAEVLGGVVCPFDVWEAAGRGVEDPGDPRRSFLFTEYDAHHTLKVEYKAWSIEVDEDEQRTESVPPRTVFGESTRLQRSSAPALASLRTPFRFERFARLGCEWNSVLDVDSDAVTAVQQSNVNPSMSHTTTPFHLSILQDASSHGVDDDDGPTLVQNMSVSSMASFSPSTASFDIGTDRGGSSGHKAHPRWSPPPDACEFVPTTHVLRSLADYGTQDILHGAQTHTNQQADAVASPENHRAFVGTALFTFGLPHRGLCGPVAAFRVAIPALRETADRVQTQLAAQDVACGCSLNFYDLVSGLGRQRKHNRSFRDLAWSDAFIDPLFRSTTYRFVSAGFDLTFAAEIPNPLSSIDLFGAHLLARPSVVERDTYRFPIATDHVPGVTLPASEESFSEVMRWVRSGGGGRHATMLVEDSDVTFSYVDSITLPASSTGQTAKRSAVLAPKVIHVLVAWTWSTMIAESATVTPPSASNDSSTAPTRSCDMSVNHTLTNIRAVVRCNVKLSAAPP